MRKCSAVCLILVLCLTLAGPALAESSFVMAGYDPASVKHVWAENYFFQRMEQNTGIHFSFRQYSDAAEWTKVKAGLAADEDRPDVLFKAQMSQDEIQSLYNAGVLIDLKPYLSECMPALSALLAEHPEWEKAITLPDGAIAALPQFNSLQSNNAMWINSSWLRMLHLDAPTTLEELTEVLRAFKTQDPNRNSKADEIPLEYTGMWDLRWFGHAFGLVADDYYLYAEDGQIRSILTDSRNRTFLEWLHMLWEERLIDHMGLSSAESLRQVTDSKATITYGIVMGPSASLMIATTASSDYDVLMPMICEGRQSYRSLLGDLCPGTFAVTDACKDPAAVLKWADILYTEAGCFLAYTGLEDKEWERNEDGTWSWLEDMETVSSSILPDSTIGEGTAIPGYVPVSYQASFDNEQVRRNVAGLDALSKAAVRPVPDLVLTAEEKKELSSVWAELGGWAETQMTWFMSGDQPLNDETWMAFCEGAEQRGLSRLVSIFQAALDRRGSAE